MSDSFLVYDGRNNLFRAVAKQAARLSEGTRLVPWRAEPTRQFLEAQFGDHLFVFVLIEPDTDTVHVGGKTVRRLLCDRGVPRRFVDTAEHAYEVMGDPLGRLIHKQTPADVDGTFPIAEDAQAYVQSLQRECLLAACGPDTNA